MTLKQSDSYAKSKVYVEKKTRKKQMSRLCGTKWHPRGCKNPNDLASKHMKYPFGRKESLDLKSLVRPGRRGVLSRLLSDLTTSRRLGPYGKKRRTAGALQTHADAR